VGETVGVEQRGGYYDTAGALRDMVPNHIMQLISLTAMEPPISFQADAVRDEQAKILHAIQPLSSEDVLTRTVRGQYGEGEMAGQHVPAYRNEPGVPPDSRTETFVAVKLQVDNWRWAGVPFYMRTGKRMASRATYIVIQFRRAPFVLFRDTGVEKLMPNQLVLHIQPEEGIALRFAAKTPGPVMRLGTVDMDFEYSDYFGKEPTWSRPDGASSVRCSIFGRPCRRAIFPTMRPAPGVRRTPKNCSSVMDGTGGTSISRARQAGLNLLSR
jgi:glucose-6-phosphate 1-dehydrogenase